MLIDIFHLGLKRPDLLTFLKLGVDRPNTTHKLVIM